MKTNLKQVKSEVERKFCVPYALASITGKPFETWPNAPGWDYDMIRYCKDAGMEHVEFIYRDLDWPGMLDGKRLTFNRFRTWAKINKPNCVFFLCTKTHAFAYDSSNDSVVDNGAMFQEEPTPASFYPNRSSIVFVAYKEIDKPKEQANLQFPVHYYIENHNCHTIDNSYWFKKGMFNSDGYLKEYERG